MSLNLVDIHGEIEGDYDIITTLPHNPSIGDMIMALFPSAKTQIIAGCFVRVTFENHENLDVSFPVGLWDSPYPNPTETNSDDNT